MPRNAESSPRRLRDSLRTQPRYVPLSIKPVATSPHTFESPHTTAIPSLRNRRGLEVAGSRPSILAVRPTVKSPTKQILEWVTPGHPLFEAMRRHAVARSLGQSRKGRLLLLARSRQPARRDFFVRELVDGLGPYHPRATVRRRITVRWNDCAARAEYAW